MRRTVVQLKQNIEHLKIQLKKIDELDKMSFLQSRCDPLQEYYNDKQQKELEIQEDTYTFTIMIELEWRHIDPSKKFD